MSFIALVKKHSTRFFVAGILLSFTSCGSFQYVGIYEDGIYHESVSVEQNQNEDYTSSSYYKNYFKEKSQNFQEENTLFTDADSYQGSYNPQNTDANNHAGWGQNSSSDVTINVYDNTPYFGYGWGSPYQNNWNWNMGWNNWMYGYRFQFNPYGYGYSPWNYPYWNYGYPGNGYYGYYGNNNGGRSLAYINGGRNSRSRNYTPSSKLLNSSSRNNSATRSNTWSATNKTSRKSGAQPSSINTNSRPTTTSRSTSKSSNSPSRTTTTRSSTRSNSSSTTRSSRSSSRSSGGTTSRRRN